MKKKFITSLIILGFFLQNCFGQLKVSSSGNVGIGPLDGTYSLLSVGQGYGNSNYTATISSISAKQGLLIENNTTSSSPSLNVGLTVANTYYSGKSTYGIRIMPNPMNGNSASGSYSLYANASGSSVECYGVAATLNGIGSAYGAAIIGSTSSLPTLQHSGQFAGYFKGDVRITGTTYTNILFPSSLNRSSQISSLSDYFTDEKTTDKLSKLNSLIINNIEGSDMTRTSDEEAESNPESIQTRMSSVRYSIDEESLREVYPELVYEDLDGNVSINYIEMIPLLLQSIKELKAEIDELKGNDFKKAASRSAGVTSIEDTEADLFSVSQNEPNPFTETTTIKLSIPMKTQRAALMIYEMSGKHIKQININERGKTSVNITSEGLTAGMYLYSLIADGKVISTKRMILTK